MANSRTTRTAAALGCRETSASAPVCSPLARWVQSVLLVLGILMYSDSLAAAPSLREYDVKAVFLYHLASFVQWPESAFAGPEAPFVIGVVGDDPFGGVLEEIVAGEYVDSHPFVIRRFRVTEEIESCHVLFISNSEGRRFPHILARLRGRPVLTVADVRGFVEAGGMIGFSTENDQLQLHVNPEAAQSAALGISSKLLELANVVRNKVAASHELAR